MLFVLGTDNGGWVAEDKEGGDLQLVSVLEEILDCCEVARVRWVEGAGVKEDFVCCGGEEWWICYWCGQ